MADVATNATIRPERLLKDLDALWVSLGKEGVSDGASAVLRACSMTMIVATEGADDQEGETLAALMREYPSRTIVLRLLEGSQPSLSARVLAQCWMPFGKRQQICCEQIEISLARSALIDVPPVVRSLTVPDLPVVLWCRRQSLLEQSEFEAVTAIANALIVDSAGQSDLKKQITSLRAQRTAARRVADLAWTRLTRWREFVAQTFDEPRCQNRFNSIDSAVVEYQGAFKPISAVYLAAWLWHALDRKIPVEMRHAGDAPRPRLYRVTLQGADLAVSVTVEQNRQVEVNASSRTSHTVMHSLNEHDLLSEELGLLGGDPVYDAVLDLAPELV